MEKGLSLVLLIVAAGIIIGAGANMWSCGIVPVEGLFLVDGSSSIGSSDGNNSSNLYKYNFTLFNSGPDIYVTTVEPVPAQSPYIVSSPASLRQQLDKLVVSGSSITIEGTIELYTENGSKEEIMNLEPIVYVNVSSTQTIPYFDQ
ncbi:hypothetical protein [Methanolobus sp. ZRKC5]|uniref:hypothetical protein n=1 Tax=unclassified Methanolobus TaxID=2629569 RepID=UPI00313D447F